MDISDGVVENTTTFSSKIAQELKWQYQNLINSQANLFSLYVYLPLFTVGLISVIVTKAIAGIILIGLLILLNISAIIYLHCSIPKQLAKLKELYPAILVSHDIKLRFDSADGFITLNPGLYPLEQLKPGLMAISGTAIAIPQSDLGQLINIDPDDATLLV